MDFVSKLPQNNLTVIRNLTTVGFKPEVIIRTSGTDKYVVFHHTKNMCAIFYDLRANEILVGADNKEFIPDLKYSLSISGNISKELLNTVARAATEYSLRKVGRFEDDLSDRMFENEEIEPGLFERTNVANNPNYQRAWAQMQKIGVDVIGDFITTHGDDADKCFDDAVADPSLQMNKISRSTWDYIIRVYKKISPYLATQDNVGVQIARANDDNDTDNVPVLSNPKKIILDTIEDENNDSNLSDEELYEKYKETLEDLSEYVNAASDVIIEHKKNRLFMTRCCLVTGTSGSSKSHTVKSTLESSGLKKNVDYYITNLAANTSQALYNMLYKNNGKIIVLDDAPNLFSRATRVAFWKAAAETTPKPLGAPNVDVAKTNNIYYNPSAIKNRKERFYKEAGWVPKTSEEMTTSDSKPSRGNSNHLKKMPAGIPDTFLFDGCVIVISNLSLDEIERQVKKEGSSDDWYAIRDRFKIITLAPAPRIIWMAVKEKIESDLKNTALNDDMRLINSVFANDVIAEVESIMNDYPDRYTFQWRTIVNIGNLLAPGEGAMPANIDKIWKRELRNMMLPKSSFK